MLDVSSGRGEKGGYFVEVKAGATGPHESMRRLGPRDSRDRGRGRGTTSQRQADGYTFGRRLAALLLSQSRAERDYGIRGHIDAREDITSREEMMTEDVRSYAVGWRGS